MNSSDQLTLRKSGDGEDAGIVPGIVQFLRIRGEIGRGQAVNGAQKTGRQYLEYKDRTIEVRLLITGESEEDVTGQLAVLEGFYNERSKEDGSPVEYSVEHPDLKARDIKTVEFRSHESSWVAGEPDSREVTLNLYEVNNNQKMLDARIKETGELKEQIAPSGDIKSSIKERTPEEQESPSSFLGMVKTAVTDANQAAEETYSAVLEMNLEDVEPK